MAAMHRGWAAKNASYRARPSFLGNTTAPDARFAFNVCIVQIQLEQWAAANASCQQAKSLNPPATLATKIDNRIEQLAQRK